MIPLNRKGRGGLGLHEALVRHKDFQRGRVLLGWFVQTQSVLFINLSACVSDKSNRFVLIGFFGQIV